MQVVTTAKVLSLTGTASTVDHKVKHEIEYRNRMGILYNTPYPIKIPQKCKCILQLDRTYVIGYDGNKGGYLFAKLSNELTQEER
ncbi:hypothetical protein Y032_0207g2036 [Ancylostoma ceylanicum]|uniref:Uncharacterized protein n=1 Tax=Ancylostoma ceylanicum TaxID=53326 RepID=A0A016SLW0_9BILA|nr:hypothetical protein Y032_0207g2036 [Ancylostoma ceylanicum]